jgi:hypothetical protein
MNKLLITTLIFVMLTITACGTASSGTEIDSATAGGPTAGELPATTKLIIGIFKLEDTAQAVTAEQATELLPLWQVYSELSTSDTASQAEVDALFEQIEGTMTSEQMQAIESMQLTQEDIFAVMQEQGIAMGGGQELSAEQIATAQAARSSGGGGFTPPDGGVPPGGMQGSGPGDGGGFDGGQGLSTEQIATARAARAESGGFNRVPSALIEALIELLKTKANS